MEEIITVADTRTPGGRTATARELPVSTPPVRRAVAMLTCLAVVSVMVSDVQGAGLSPLVGSISKDLGLTSSQVGWIINGYTLMGAACSGIISRLGDLLGHRKLLIVALVLAFVGAVFCAFSTSLPLLIAGRVLIGFSIPVVPLIWGLTRPRTTAQENRRISLWLGTAAAVGAALALVLGGALLRLGAPWQSVFWICAALLAVMLLLAVMSPESPRATRDHERVDWAGGVGLAIWLVALLLAVSSGLSRGWTSRFVVTCFAVFVVVLAAWIVQQVRNPDRLMAFHRQELRQMAAGYSGVWSIYLATMYMYTFEPALLQTPRSAGYGFGLDVLGSSLPLLTLLPAAVIVQVSLGRLLPWVGPRPVLCGGAVLGAAGFLGLAFFHGQLAVVPVWVFIFAVGVLACYVCGFALTTAAGRQDNIAITVGLQYAGGNIVASIAAAVVLGMLVPDTAGVLPEHVFTSGLAQGGIAMLGLGVLWLFLAPKRLVDNHAMVSGPVDANPKANPNTDHDANPAPVH